jgi:hypothetical protein
VKIENMNENKSFPPNQLSYEQPKLKPVSTWKYIFVILLFFIVASVMFALSLKFVLDIFNVQGIQQSNPTPAK